jgi:DNA-binding IscR family transcriptional regulator
MASEIGISPEAALRLLGQLVEAGIVREVTGRAAWRAYSIA